MNQQRHSVFVFADDMFRRRLRAMKMAESDQGGGRMRPAGFSLIEMLVVVAVILLLVSLLMPAFQRAEAMANKVTCLSNMKQLTTSWVLFANDNDGTLINLHTCGGCWVQGGGGTSPIINGTLYPYIRDVRSYRCPADTSGYTRSYSGNSMLNGESGVPPGAIKLGNMRRPSQTFVFMEEYDNRLPLPGYNVGSYIVPASPTCWTDVPASWHKPAGANVCFADGHGEFLRWIDTTTSSLICCGPCNISLNDLAQMQAIYSPW